MLRAEKRGYKMDLMPEMPKENDITVRHQLDLMENRRKERLAKSQTNFFFSSKNVGSTSRTGLSRNHRAMRASHNSFATNKLPNRASHESALMPHASTKKYQKASELGAPTQVSKSGVL